MARIVRPMKKDPTDPLLPLVAQRFCCLGVRAHEVDVDAVGNVIVNRRGLSVSEDWRNLPPDIIPIEEDDAVNGACGKKMAIFVHGQGTGPFAEGPVAAGLENCFKPGKTDAGEVCPVALVPRPQYESDLAAIRPDWVIDHS